VDGLGRQGRGVFQLPQDGLGKDAKDEDGEGEGADGGAGERGDGEQILFGGALRNSDGSGDGQVPRERCGPAVAFVDEQEIGGQFARQADGRAFAFMQLGYGLILWPALEPAARPAFRG